MIDVVGLQKIYRVPVKDPGLAGTMRSLWDRRYKEVRAVDGISFHIEPGERVGFLGPNGAGKTTTLKMLSGLLYPTAGTVKVGGSVPQERKTDFLRSITLVMGQKQQLLWDLPARETFELNRAMYGVPVAQYKQTLEELVTMLQVEPLLEKPVRNLSLGERMKCELVAALVHRPQVLFLDEPTIGLDVEMQVQVRAFIQDCNKRFGATILLTSHYMQDIEALTPRLLIIDKGTLRYDGGLAELSQRVAPERRVIVRGTAEGIEAMGFTAEDGRFVAQVPAAEVNPLLTRVLARWPLVELNVEEPPLEEVIGRVFRGAA